MAGAYVAKPAVDLPPPEGPPTVDDVPPGWDLNWPFPGPYPPGYAPELTLPMTATETIRFFGTAAVTGEFRDHTIFVTNEPDAVVLTAVIASSPSRDINLRFSGDSEYASSVSINCTLADYWGVGGDVEFELTRADEGGIITLTGTGAISGVTVTDTVEIIVYEPIYSLVMSGTTDMAYDGTASITTSLRDHETLGTDEPTGSTLTWTATIDGVAVDLRFSGDTEYSESISSSYSDIGDYWGAEKDIEFDLTAENNGDTIVLRVESTVFEEDLNITHDISVSSMSCTVSIGGTAFTCDLPSFTQNEWAVWTRFRIWGPGAFPWSPLQLETSVYWNYQKGPLPLSLVTEVETIEQYLGEDLVIPEDITVERTDWKYNFTIPEVDPTKRYTWECYISARGRFAGTGVSVAGGVDAELAIGEEAIDTHSEAVVHPDSGHAVRGGVISVEDGEATITNLEPWDNDTIPSILDTW